MTRLAFITAVIVSPIMALGCGASLVHGHKFDALLWLVLGLGFIGLCWQLISQDLAQREVQKHTLVQILQTQLSINQMERTRLERELLNHRKAGSQ